MEDFTPMRVSFRSAGGASSARVLYCKRHSVRLESPLTPNGRTLFTVGWPAYCSDEDAAQLFSRAGQVTGVFLQQSPGSVAEGNPLGGRATFRVGYIVFSDDADAAAALRMADTPSTIPCPVGPVGVARWARDYEAERPPLGAMEARVAKEMKAYDERKEVEERAGRKRLSEADADGWVTVKKRRATQQPTRRERKKKKVKELLNFYSFQQREGQREKVAELRRKFEQDKRRVEDMKARRKFKPF